MPDYNPINEPVKKQYEEILLHAKGRDKKTVRGAWRSINMFEKSTGYLDFKTFDKQQAQNFKSWLEKRKNDKGKPLSLATIRSTLKNTRDFFEWLAIHPNYVRKVNSQAIPYLNLSGNANRAARASKDKIPPTLEELETALCGMPSITDIQKRDRAIFAFTIITCARDASIISIKRKDVDVKHKTVWQDPKHVGTKFRKGIFTRFVSQPLQIAEDIVLQWVKYIDDLGFTPNDPLFPKTHVQTNPKTMAFEVQGLSREHWAGAQAVRDIFKAAFTSVGLPYYHPHLFRKTITKWGMKNMNQYEFKAFSQNIGHEHAMTTYNSYGKLTEDEQVEAIASVGRATESLQNIQTKDLMSEVERRMNK